MRKQFRIYCDVETTGFDPIRNDVVSVALIVTDRNLNKISEFYETARPEFNKFYDAGAEAVHGITKKEMQTFQSQERLCKSILKFLSPYKDNDNFPQLFVSHCLKSFDYRFLEWCFRKQNLQYSMWKIIRDDFQRSTILEGRRKGFKGNRLDEWAKRIGFNLHHHHALSDTACCLAVDKYLKGCL